MYELITVQCSACRQHYEAHPLQNAFGPYGSLCHECRCAKQTLEQLQEPAAPPVAEFVSVDEERTRRSFRDRLRDAWQAFCD